MIAPRVGNGKRFDKANEIGIERTQSFALRTPYIADFSSYNLSHAEPMMLDS